MKLDINELNVISDLVNQERQKKEELGSIVTDYEIDKAKYLNSIIALQEEISKFKDLIIEKYGLDANKPYSIDIQTGEIN